MKQFVIYIFLYLKQENFGFQKLYLNREKSNKATIIVKN